MFRRCSRRKGIEVDELAAEAEDRFVEHVIKLDCRAQPHLFAQTKFAGDVEVEEKLAGTLTGVARQVSRLADGRQGKQIQDRRDRLDRRARASEAGS